MVAARVSEASGATAETATKARDLAASWAAVAMARADGDSSRLAAERTAAARVTTVGGNKRGQLAAASAAAWEALVFQQL